MEVLWYYHTCTSYGSHYQGSYHTVQYTLGQAVSGIQQLLYGQHFCVAASDIIFSKLMFFISKKQKLKVFYNNELFLF